jgi:menaquinone-9 beta-reductase
VDDHYDVAVIGAGPAGSVAAIELARAGARVALVDKARFPRDKACGDLIGPRGVQVLHDLGVSVPGATAVGEMRVVGPARSVRLPCFPGLTYPGYALAVRRAVLDDTLSTAAADSGATSITGHAHAPLFAGAGELEGFQFEDGTRVRADFVIGADGATTRVGDVAGLVDRRRVLWGFAVRGYLEHDVDLPTIVFWERQPGRALPGYGWLFPGPDSANLGVGIGTRHERSAAAAVTRELHPFVDHLYDRGLLRGQRREIGRLGGWLKMGMVGTVPARGGVLLVGDAAGLVNPLQGEGISQAMTSGRAAARAIVSTPGVAASRYREHLAGEHLPYQRITAALQATLLDHPRVIAAVARALTSRALVRPMAGGWAVFWNELLDGAPPNAARQTAAAVTKLASVFSARSETGRWFEQTFGRSAQPPQDEQAAIVLG